MSILKRSSLIGLALVILLSGGWTSAAQETSQNDGFLLSALFRTRGLIDRTTADLQKIDREIQENDRVIKRAEEIIVLAGQRNNKQAESVARDAQLKAREARKKNEDTKVRLELVRKRATASNGALKNRLASSLGGGVNPPVKGMVSAYSGRVQVSKKSGETFELRADDPGLLEAGDAILTYGSSSAEVQALDGRGTVQLGEYSELKLQEDTPEKQVLELVRGKVYSAVDKADDFANMLQEETKQFGSDFLTVANVSEKEYEAVIKSLRARAQKKFEIRAPSWVMAVRGTKFTVELKNGETTEMTVFEGSVEAGDLRGEKRVLVEEGFKVIMTKDGISGPQKIADVEKWWDK
jgi:ferric-dicitrate binding protein FerR (iron transport regulator)